jgi:hypothetical protein
MAHCRSGGGLLSHLHMCKFCRRTGAPSCIREDVLRVIRLDPAGFGHLLQGVHRELLRDCGAVRVNGSICVEGFEKIDRGFSQQVMRIDVILPCREHALPTCNQIGDGDGNFNVSTGRDTCVTDLRRLLVLL